MPNKFAQKEERISSVSFSCLSVRVIPSQCYHNVPVRVHLSCLSHRLQSHRKGSIISDQIVIHHTGLAGSQLPVYMMDCNVTNKPECSLKFVFISAFSYPLFPSFVQFTLIAIKRWSVSTATDAVVCVPHVHLEYGCCGRHRCR